MRAQLVRLLLCVSGLLLLVTALPGLSSAVSAEPVRPREWPRGCAGSLQSAVTKDTVRVCEQSTVMLDMKADCDVCAGGLHVVFVQVDRSKHAEWMKVESLRGLDELSQRFTGTVRAAMVEYNGAGARSVVSMTERLDDVRAGLSRPLEFEDDPQLAFVPAAEEALAQLRAARPESDEPVMPCEMIVFFGRGVFVPLTAH